VPKWTVWLATLARSFPLKTELTIGIACLPDILTIAMAPTPLAVASAHIAYSW